VRNPIRWVMRGVAVVILALVVLGLVGLAVMLLWNAVVPAVFHGPLLQYWQAVGLLILSRLLVGGLRGRGWHGGWRGRRWRERWEQMSPEERAQMRERFMSRCGAARAAQPPPN
jgi:hypothetical protein